MRHFAAIACLVVPLTVACDSDRASGRDDPMATGGTAGGGAGSGGSSGDPYPEGPYGTEIGSTIANLTFVGWRDPKAAGYAYEATESLALDDFYDPDGEGGSRVLLVNAVAAWCAACQVEHTHLADLIDDYGERGFRIISAMTQNSAFDPPGVTEAAVWAEQFSIAFPYGYDNPQFLHLYGSATQMPLNLLVDTQTMEILWKMNGTSEPVLRAAIEETLAGSEPVVP